MTKSRHEAVWKFVHDFWHDICVHNLWRETHVRVWHRSLLTITFKRHSESSNISRSKAFTSTAVSSFIILLVGIIHFSIFENLYLCTLCHASAHSNDQHLPHRAERQCKHHRCRPYHRASQSSICNISWNMVLHRRTSTVCTNMRLNGSALHVVCTRLCNALQL